MFFDFMNSNQPTSFVNRSVGGTYFDSPTGGRKRAGVFLCWIAWL
jgi:hypothetical protein